MTLNHYSSLDLQRHAHELARAFGVHLIEEARLKPEEAAAVPHLRAVVVSPIIDETTYAVALHEIGHVASPTGYLRVVKETDNAVEVRQLVSGSHADAQRAEEDAAWEWAQHYALDWTPAMEAVKAYGRGTYDAPSVKPLATGKKTINWSNWK